MLLLGSSVCGLFKWRQFEPEVILLAVGWYLRFSLSYRNVEELLGERGLQADHASDSTCCVGELAIETGEPIFAVAPRASVTCLVSSMGVAASQSLAL